MKALDPTLIQTKPRRSKSQEGEPQNDDSGIVIEIEKGEPQNDDSGIVIEIERD